MQIKRSSETSPFKFGCLPVIREDLDGLEFPSSIKRKLLVDNLYINFNETVSFLVNGKTKCL
jgi:hypothetical protein